ncbi:MAG: hypothetical protein FWE84_05835 [Firmicutes bacterium]|nr:hypothetical protein [Bacillota bacterium]
MDNTAATSKSASKSAKIELTFLGFVSLLVGVLCMLDAHFVHGLSPLTSISESATTGNMAGMLLPFALGCMFTFTISYQGYCASERVITKIIGGGFAIVAMQVCDSPYVDEARVGLLGLPPHVSGIVHLVGSGIGFGMMWVWVTFYFTRSDKEKSRQTKQKIIRNYIYIACGAAMLCGLVMLVIGSFIDFGKYLVFIAEEFILIPAGIAILVKSGFFLADKTKNKE